MRSQCETGLPGRTATETYSFPVVILGGGSLVPLGCMMLLKELQKKFGFAPDHVVSVARELLGKKESTNHETIQQSRSHPARPG